MTKKDTEQSYWSKRYRDELTGWDIGYPSQPLRVYIDEIEDHSKRILIPGAGNAYEAEYLFKQGFTNVFILDIAHEPLKAFRKRVPAFSAANLIHDNFFEHEAQYDLIFEQTFFCSFPPTSENRTRYAKKMNELLVAEGKLVGLYFDFPLTGDMEKRPFGGDREEYLNYFNPYFNIKSLDPCYNSIPSRAGKELFGIFIKK